MVERTFHSLLDLLEAGVIKIAEEPPGNWRDAEGLRAYTVPLLAEDYPAKTAVMWNAVYEKFGMPDRNVMIVANPDDAAVILEALRRDPKYRGGGCGIGFKEKVIPFLDAIASPLAKAMGAVNIIRKTLDNRLLGDNTDGRGYALSLEEKFRERGEALGGKRILIIGGGGSARAIAFALAERGAELIIRNRTESKAHSLAKDVNVYLGKKAASGGPLSYIVLKLEIGLRDAVVAAINSATTPLDRYSPLGIMRETITDEAVEKNLKEAGGLLRQAKPSLIVSDIRIRKYETAMLAQARELGFETLDGIPMVVNQGIEAFWWLYGDELAAKGRTKSEVAAIMAEAAKLTG